MIKEFLHTQILQVLQDDFGISVSRNDLLISPTKKEFKGDYTLTVFPLASRLKMKPMDAGQAIGNKLADRKIIRSFEVIQGFLNLMLPDTLWLQTFDQIRNSFGLPIADGSKQKILVEFCSPNTNKPLHLGHIRNILLGESTARMLQFLGHEVQRIQVVNDRGIAICKSMLAWKKWGNNMTPDDQKSKGDHFVGIYYVMFEKEFSKEYTLWQKGEQAQAILEQKVKSTEDPETFFKGFKNEYFNQYSALGQEARDLLISWENSDPEVLKLWRQMNDWVLEGFAETCQKLGVHFDHSDFESTTYLLGKETVEEGLAHQIFYQKEDSSVWIDLTEAGLDHKLVLRKDGTSVYITQDLGTAKMRYDKFKMDRCIYVVADEQDYHFKVLFEILKRLNLPFAGGLYHLSYGMVELPDGKMKSREGTVVDADDLIAEVIQEATRAFNERGEWNELPEPEKQALIETIALGAIKFFLLKVQPKKRMIFNPKESLDLQGQTGPYVQNAYVRIRSILRKSNVDNSTSISDDFTLESEEKELIFALSDFNEVILKAARAYDPSEVANYSYSLARAFHRFYHEIPILRTAQESQKQFRLALADQVGLTLQKSFELIGINMPERM
jgi:arginyl-tRNA synthetase